MPTSEAAKSPQCFVGFYGVDRSLRWTAHSIKQHILAPLARAGFSCFLAGHFNLPAIIENPASGERRVKLRHRPAKHLDLHLNWTEPQTDEPARDLIEAALSVPFRDYDDPTGATRRNIAFQLHSLRRLSSLVDVAGPERFDAFLLLRPDVEYIDPIEVGRIVEIASGETDFVTPSWHLWGGMNDRFCFGNYRAARAYMNRGDLLPEFCRKYGYVHPEALLSDAIAREGLRVTLTEQRALRVRATGETRAEGFRLRKTARLVHRARPLLNAFA